MPQLSIRVPEPLLRDLQEEAARHGFASVSEYVRRQLGAPTRIEARLARMGEAVEQLAERNDRSHLHLSEQVARVENRLEEIAARLGLAETTPAFTPSRQVYSTQFGRMVDVDADGREIPPE